MAWLLVEGAWGCRGCGGVEGATSRSREREEWDGKCVNDAVFPSATRLRGVEIVSVEATQRNQRRVYRCCLARREGGGEMLLCGLEL